MQGHAERMSSEYAVAAAEQPANDTLHPAYTKSKNMSAPPHTALAHIQSSIPDTARSGGGGELPAQHATHSAAGSFVTYVHRNTLCLPFHVAITPDRVSPRALQMAHRAHMEEIRQHGSNTLVILNDGNTQNNNNSNKVLVNEDGEEGEKSLVCYGTTAPPSRVTSANITAAATMPEPTRGRPTTHDTNPLLQPLNTTTTATTTTTNTNPLTYMPRSLSSHRALYRPATVHRWRFFVTDTPAQTMSRVHCTKPSTAHGTRSSSRNTSSGLYRADHGNEYHKRATSAMAQAMHSADSLTNRPVTSPVCSALPSKANAVSKVPRLPEELLPDRVSSALRRLRHSAGQQTNKTVTHTVSPVAASAGAEVPSKDNEVETQATQDTTQQGDTTTTTPPVMNTTVKQASQSIQQAVHTTPETNGTPVVLPAVTLHGHTSQEIQPTTTTTTTTGAMSKPPSVSRSHASPATCSSSSTTSYATAGTLNTNTELSISKPSHSTTAYETSFSMPSQHSTSQHSHADKVIRSSLSCMQPPSTWSTTQASDHHGVRCASSKPANRLRDRLTQVQYAFPLSVDATAIDKTAVTTTNTTSKAAAMEASDKAQIEEENRLGVLAVTYQRCLQSAADTLHYEPEDRARLLNLGAVFKEINLQQLYPKRHPLIDVKRAVHHHHHHHHYVKKSNHQNTTSHSSGSAVKGHGRMMHSPMHGKQVDEQLTSPHAMSCVEHILQPLTDAWQRSEALAEQRRALGRRLRRPSARHYTLDTLLEGDAAAQRVGRPLSASPEMEALLNEHHRAVMQVHELQEAERQDALSELPPM